MPALSAVRLAFRLWIKRPAFAITAILTLALGIGATTAIFSVVDAVLLKPLPWRDPDRLISVLVARPHWRDNPVLTANWDRGNISWTILKDLQSKSRVFSEFGAWSWYRPTLNGERNEPVVAPQISASFLPMLGLAPHAGRFFTAEEDDGPSDSVLVTYECWQRRFGETKDILGRRVSLDDKFYSVVGVVPPGFNFDGLNRPEFLLPLGNTPVVTRTAGNHFLNGVGRLISGIPLEDAVRDTDPYVRGTEPATQKQARLIRLADHQQASSRLPLWILLGASALVLLIACANVAGLLLGEAESRRHEIAVRAALGGARRQIVWQLFVENSLLAGAAAVLGIVLASWLTPTLAAMAPAQLPRLANVTIDFRVAAFSALISFAAALLFGTVPSVALASVDPVRSLREGGRDSGLRRRYAQPVIVAAEVALAVVLLAAASLLGETLVRLTSEPVGFNAGNLIVASPRLPRDPTPEKRVARMDALISGLAALPGVVAVSATSSAPFSGSFGSNSIQIEGKKFERDPPSNRHVVTDTYFETLRIPIVKGRGFESTDLPGSYVAVVSQEFERRYMDGEAIGKRFTLNDNVHTVVGVVPVTKHREYNDEEAPAMYVLSRQMPGWAVGTYIVRTATAPEHMIAAVRKSIETLEPLSSILTIETMTQMMRRSVAEERFRAQVSIIFGITALLLAGLGLYGLVARGVADRSREIGVRMAVGARPWDVQRMVLAQGIRLVTAGLVAGVPAALLATQVIGSMLYGVTPTSPRTLAAVAVVLSGAALCATILPARRAVRIDPVAALRGE